MTDAAEGLRALAERVEGLTGPCREMDGDVAEALRLPPHELARCSSRRGFWYRQVADADFDTWEAPTYTASLDAVVALIAEKLPGFLWMVGHAGDTRPGQYAAILMPPPALTGVDVARTNATPALALLAATLRAIKEKTDDR
jgi:hypothetical protein